MPPWNLVGSGRFDDPRAVPQYRALYAGDRRACFYESLADFRVSVELEGITNQGVTGEWLESRRIAAFRVLDTEGRRGWLDLNSPEIFAELRIEFIGVLNQLGLTDFDVSAATSDKRSLTQAVGLWANERGYTGIRYMSRHAPSYHCWAIFEGARLELEVIDVGSEISRSDDDLQAVARAWTLPLPSTLD